MAKLLTFHLTIKQMFATLKNSFFSKKKKNIPRKINKIENYCTINFFLISCNLINFLHDKYKKNNSIELKLTAIDFFVWCNDWH